MPAHKASAIELSVEHEHELNVLVRTHSTPQKLAERARIILLAASGLGVEETADELGIWRKTASTWRRRWMGRGGNRRRGGAFERRATVRGTSAVHTRGNLQDRGLVL